MPGNPALVIVITKITDDEREFRVGLTDSEDMKPWLRDPDFPADSPRVNRDELLRVFNSSTTHDRSDSALSEASYFKRLFSLYSDDILFVDHSDIVFPFRCSQTRPVLPNLSGETSPG